MLNIPGHKTRLCDGVSRRSFLKIGGFAFGGYSLGLADVLRAQAASPNGRQKALINIFLSGGPPHQDMWELKNDAPADIRGPLRPIRTKVPGIEICELFPKIAARMDRCAVIRSVVGNDTHHASHQCMTGWPMNSLTQLGGRPSIGAVVSKLQGSASPAIPPFVGLAKPTAHIEWSDCGTPGFLGPTYSAFKPDGPGLANLTLNGVTTQELADRRKLLKSLDTMRRDLDTNGTLVGMDAFSERAFSVLTSSKLVDALDIFKETAKVRERYGDGKPYKFQYDGAPTCNDQLLMARRLVESGVRVVSLSYGRWDSHGDNFGLMRDHGPKLDQCVAALHDDLVERGLIDDVTVIVWGEFGRTPRINKENGRDHWPQVSCALVFGGGIRGGQAIGSTNRLGEFAKDRPVHVQELVATLYQNLGIDSRTTTINDPTGRPQYLVERGQPMPELV